MKRIFFIVLFLTTALSYKCEAQQGNDTLAILQNIISNKADYIGQPFSTLLNQLPIQIKFFMPLTSPIGRIIEASTNFAFYFPATPDQVKRTNPGLIIYWQQPLKRRQSTYLFYQTNGAWSTTLSSYYGNAIIADITILR